MIATPVIAESREVAVTGTSTAFGAAMVAGQVYLFSSSVGCWLAQGSAPVATAGNGSMYVPANTLIEISGDDGADIAVIQDASSGRASLTRVQKA